MKKSSTHDTGHARRAYITPGMHLIAFRQQRHLLSASDPVSRPFATYMSDPEIEE